MFSLSDTHEITACQAHLLKCLSTKQLHAHLRCEVRKWWQTLFGVVEIFSMEFKCFNFSTLVAATSGSKIKSVGDPYVNFSCSCCSQHKVLVDTISVLLQNISVSTFLGSSMLESFSSKNMLSMIQFQQLPMRE